MTDLSRMTDLFEVEFLSNAIADYAIAIAILVIGFIAVAIVRTIILSRMKRWATRTAVPLDERLIQLIERPAVRLLYLGVIYVAVGNLTLHPILERVLDVVCIIVATVLVVSVLCSVLEYSVRAYWFDRRESAALEQTFSALLPALKIVIWAIGVVFLLSNLGFDISAVIAGLGIGGLAVALAAQGVLADLFSYFSILLDRPFEIGDFILVGDFIGTVEKIGITTTRLQSLTGEGLVISNTDLTASRIKNFKRMKRRRITFALGVTYETTHEQMKGIPAVIKEIVDRTEGVSFDRAHFLSYGDFSLNYEVVYYVETPDFGVYADAQQQINLDLKEAFEARGIEFAYPTQVLYLNQMNSDASNSNGSGNSQAAALSQ
jgi:small-conductance mechanosensitive channel